MEKQVERLAKLMHILMWTDAALFIWFVKSLLVLL